MENLEFYTCTLWDHNAIFLITAYWRKSWVPNDCILVGINETKWTTFDFMRNDVLQNYLDQFLKCLADNFDNLKFQDASKVAILDYQIVTSCIAIVKVVFSLFIWKEMTWKIPNLENLEFYTCTLWDHNGKIFNYGLQEEVMGAKWLQFDRNKWN